MKISLTHQEKSVLERRHQKCSDKRECDRIKAVLLSAEGWTVVMISQALRKHQTSIARHLNDYTISKKITSENGGSDSYLNEAQTTTAIAHLSDVTYFNMSDIKNDIKENFDVEYSISG